MKTLLTAGLILLSAPSALATEWTRDTADGLIFAGIKINEMSYLEALCDVGFNAPITSISFMVQGNLPDPGTEVEFRFGKDQPIFAMTDEEGVIPSLTETDAATFTTLLNGFRDKSAVTLRLPNGVRETFSLKGSTEALNGCTPDLDRVEEIDLALGS